jgi:DNA-binding MarR family transcriptional regulator
MVATDLSAKRCAVDILETVPVVMHFLKAKVKDYAGTNASLPQIRALGFIKMHPGASLSKVADHMSISSATASSIVERLVQKGLVERKDHRLERRFIELNLTPEGKKQFNELHLYASSQLSDLLKELPDAQLANLLEAMKTLRTVFEQNNPGVDGNNESD